MLYLILDSHCYSDSVGIFSWKDTVEVLGLVLGLVLKPSLQCNSMSISVIFEVFFDLVTQTMFTF